MEKNAQTVVNSGGGFFDKYICLATQTPIKIHIEDTIITQEMKE